MVESKEYRVIWVIELCAESHRDAAEQTHEIMLDPDSEALVFNVQRYPYTSRIEGEEIDLMTKKGR